MAQAGGSVRKQWQLSNAGCAPQAEKNSSVTWRYLVQTRDAPIRYLDMAIASPSARRCPDSRYIHDAAASHPEAASSAVGTAAAATAATSAAKARVFEAQGHLAWLRPRFQQQPRWSHACSTRGAVGGGCKEVGSASESSYVSASRMWSGCSVRRRPVQRRAWASPSAVGT